MDMSTSAAAEIQKKKPSDLLQQINQMLDQALKAKTFSPETVREFEERGKAARQERKMLDMRPTPTERKPPVAKAVPSKELEMTRPAVVAALKLAEMFELAGSARTLNVKPWVEGGKLA
jgi:hypothetical protein